MPLTGFWLSLNVDVLTFHGISQLVSITCCVHAGTPSCILCSLHLTVEHLHILFRLQPETWRYRVCAGCKQLHLGTGLPANVGFCQWLHWHCGHQLQHDSPGRDDILGSTQATDRLDHVYARSQSAQRKCGADPSAAWGHKHLWRHWHDAHLHVCTTQD